MDQRGPMLWHLPTIRSGAVNCSRRDHMRGSRLRIRFPSNAVYVMPTRSGIARIFFSRGGPMGFSSKTGRNG